MNEYGPVVISYGALRKSGCAGFGHLYLGQCNKQSKPDDEIDFTIYTKLVELDSKLGTTASEQLLQCLLKTTRSDIIKVQIFPLNGYFKIILDYRLCTSESI